MKTAQKIIVGLIVGMAALILQSTLLKFMLADHAIPNFCFIFVVFLAFNEVSIAGAVLVFLLGLLFDLSSGVILGPWAGAFAASYTVLCLVSRRVFLDSVPAAFLLTFLGAYFSNLIYILLVFQFHVVDGYWMTNLVESSITAVIGPFVLSFFYALFVKRWNIFASRGTGAA